MGRGRPQKYAWVNWLDGERHVLNSRRDFPDVDVHSFRQQALNEAARRGVEISTRIRVDPMGDGIDYIEVTRKKPEPMKRLNWDEELANLPRTFEHGKDFTCSTESMRVRVYQAAQRRGPLPVRIRIAGTTVVAEPIVQVVGSDSLTMSSSVTEMAPTEEEQHG